jgi:dephospho-CoA kinase
MKNRLETIKRQMEKKAMTPEQLTEIKSNQADSEFNIGAKDCRTPITRICLTGGPCAGKTTALTELSLMLT